MPSDLFQPMHLGALHIRNRVAMAPMTRSRASADGTPGSLAARYYGERAGAGLIIAEATQISRQGQGFPNTPGIFTQAHVAGWRTVTDEVHARGGAIVLQLWHVGRTSFPAHQPDGGLPVGPSPIAAQGEGMLPDFSKAPYVAPRALSVAEIAEIVVDFATAATLAREAGFDGIELHAANAYLIDQFLNDRSNRRDDAYGGSVENRSRFLLEVTQAVADAIGADRVGVRVSPYSSFYQSDSDPVALFGHIAAALRPFGLAYLHLIEPPAGHFMAADHAVPLASELRAAFGGPLMLNGGLDRDTATAALADGRADLVSLGVPWLANPDLLDRWQAGEPLNAPRPEFFYGGGAEGYTDYPALDAEPATAE